MTNNDQLTSEQLRALDLLMSGATSEEVGQIVGKSARTIERWKKLEPFARVMSEVHQKVQDNLIDEYASRMTRLGLKAMGVVEEVLDDGDESTRNRLQAASLAGKWADLDANESKAAVQLLQLLDSIKEKVSKDVYDQVSMALAVRGGFKEERAAKKEEN